jgi:phage shock protein PspC (stress-responsive transcriptional regulator)
MNKTININLGGIFFHIDEIAYQKLKRYVDAIRRSLSDDPKGRDEIISDIELRIGELLSERVKDVRQVVSESDIDEVITVMGQPEDYLVDEELFKEDAKTQYSGSRSDRRSSNKKLFRDGEDKFLGGVSSGIAYYFDVDVIWIRIAWLVATFGLGFGPILYIILWILLPEAKTTADKLQMEGEPVNISNIERRVRAEFEDASTRIKDAANDVGDKVKEGFDNVSDSLKKKRISSNNSRSGIHEFVDVIGKIIVTFFMIIGKFIGVILIITAVTALVAVIISSFTAGTLGFMGIDSLFDGAVQVMNPTGIPTWIVSILLLILLGIPFLMLFFLGLFIISSKSTILSRTAKFVLLGIWLFALLTAIFYGVRQSADFARDGSSIVRHDILAIPNDTLTLKMVDNEDLSDNDNFEHRIFFREVLDENDALKYYSNDVNLYIRKSDSTEAYMRIVKKANGRTRLIARKNAEEITYNFNQTGDNLFLNSYFLSVKNNRFRNLDLRIVLYIPENQVLFLDENTKSYLRRMKTTNDMYNRDMADHYFEMTDDGLKCLDCKKNEDGWKYEDTSDGDEKSGLNVNINRDSLKIEINDNGEKAEIKLDENGLIIK